MKRGSGSGAKKGSDDYVIRVFDDPLALDATAWNALLARQAHPTPFMRHEYLAALHASGSANARTGWSPAFVTLWRGGELAAACPLYRKSHSYGEYVFDWAWASAYERHGLDYYPKALVAVPFTPVPGSRLMAADSASRAALVEALVHVCGEEKLSSLHLLFGDEADIDAARASQLMLRHNVQFHWQNLAPTLGTDVSSLPPEGAAPPWERPGGGAARYTDFDAFLASLNHEKRKKIRQERRKVADAGVSFRWSAGAGISQADWDFFYRCYEQTYLEHGNAPYLTRDFFHRMQHTLPQHWLLFVAERGGRPIATSLIATTQETALTSSHNHSENPAKIAWGRYWGALERVDCLHFEACYYQPLQWCIAHGFDRFEGGAQGEHKMARALMPVATTSAHWLAHPAFADAVDRFLTQEGEGIANYLDHLKERSPFRERE